VLAARACGWSRGSDDSRFRASISRIWIVRRSRRDARSLSDRSDAAYAAQVFDGRRRSSAMEDELQSRSHRSISLAVVASASGGGHAGDTSADADFHTERSLTLAVDPFAWEALEEESAQQGVSVEELVSFSILYYLADSDSGRIARRLPQPTAASGAGQLLVGTSHETRKQRS
jgi:hypothetical protein